MSDVMFEKMSRVMVMTPDGAEVRVAEVPDEIADGARELVKAHMEKEYGEGYVYLKPKVLRPKESPKPRKTKKK